MNKEIVSLKNVWIDYEGLSVLEEVNLSIEQNDFLGIIGPNGGGKTTLLKVILGLIMPAVGEVRVFGVKPHQARKLIGYVSQRSLFDRDFPINVWETVLMGRLGHVGCFRHYRPEDKEICRQILKKVEMFSFRDRQMGRLSEGQKQRVIIARALVTQPKLLLLDEPTASIDTPMETELYELLNELKKEMAIVLVSHDIGVISGFVDKIACLNHRLFYHDSKEMVLKDLEAAYQCPVEMLAHGIPHRVLKEH